MKYLIMILIIIGLALADYFTGIIKAYCSNSLSSGKMRKGGLNKLAELIVMIVVCGLDIGLNKLGAFYQCTELSAIAGNTAAILVFAYICIMEIVSIFENYAEINPDAKWAADIIRRLKNSQKEDDKNDIDK